MKSILLTILVCILTVQLSNAQWVQVSNGMGNKTANALAYSGNNIFAGTDAFGVYLSTNNGDNWIQTSLNNQTIEALAVNGNNVFAGANSGFGVYWSPNNGTSWLQTPLNNRNVYALAVNGNNIFAGTGGNYGVYISTDNGVSWTQTSLNNRDVYSLAVNGNNIFAGTGSYGVYLSTNNGVTWTQTPLNNQEIYSLAVNGNNIFAGIYNPNGVYLSINNGTTWAQTSLNNQRVLSLAANGNNIFAGTDIGNGVYVSNNNGTNWMQRNEGLINPPPIHALSILNGYIFAGTYGYSVYRRPLNELIGITPISNEIPSQFSLSQNYPNPFNPSTVISFQIAVNSYAALNIYDIIGRHVTTLVNEQLSPGTYEIEFDGSNYSSGVYYYKLSAGDYTGIKKMILLK